MEMMKEHVAELIRDAIPVLAVVIGGLLTVFTNWFLYTVRRKAERKDHKARADVERLEALYERIYDLRRQFERQIELIDYHSQLNKDQTRMPADEAEEMKRLGYEIMDSFVFIRMKIRLYHPQLGDSFSSLFDGLFRMRSYTEIKDSILSQDPKVYWTELVEARKKNYRIIRLSFGNY